MSMETFEVCEKMFCHRDKIYAAEMHRLSGAPTYSSAEIDQEMEELFRTYEKDKGSNK